MADKQEQYSTKTNMARKIKPSPPIKLSGNFTNAIKSEKSNNQVGLKSDLIGKNSMNTMLINDFWTMFEKNIEKMTKNPFVPKDPLLLNTAPQASKAPNKDPLLLNTAPQLSKAPNIDVSDLYEKNKTSPQASKTSGFDLFDKSKVDIERTRENIYNLTTKTISLQERFKETPQANPPMQTPHTTGKSSGRGAGGGGNNVTINNMATIDQVTIAAVMLPIWRQGFVG